MQFNEQKKKKLTKQKFITSLQLGNFFFSTKTNFTVLKLHLMDFEFYFKISFRLV